MDFSGLLVLGIVWMLFNLLGMGKRTARSAPRHPAPQPRPGGVRGPGDATQQEGSRLERLLRELERNLEEVEGTQPPGGSRLDEPDSLEEPVRVVSLETDVQRPLRVPYDQDADAEALVERRIESARARDRAPSRADRRAFEQQIRQEPADHTAVPRYTPQQLRDAVVWREILGPPRSERE